MTTFEALVEQLKAEDPLKRDYAVEDLTALNDLRAIKVIAEHLESEKSLQVRETMISALQTLCLSVVEPIAPLLYSDNPQIRNGAVGVLHEAGESVIRLLDRLSQDPNKDVRKFAIDALKGKNSATAITVLRNRLNDDDPNVRITAIEYLGELRDQESAPKILEILKNNPPVMATATCLEALANINAPASAIALDYYPKLEDIPPMLLFSYVKLLGMAGNGSHFELLGSLIKTQGALLGKELIDAIEGICQREQHQSPPQSLLNPLKALFEKVTSPPLRYQIFHFLLQYDGETRLETARSYLEAEDLMIQMASLEVISQYGTQQDLSTLERLADQVEDDELLETIGETLAEVEARVSIGETS